MAIEFESTGMGTGTVTGTAVGTNVVSSVVGVTVDDGVTYVVPTPGIGCGAAGC